MKREEFQDEVVKILDQHFPPRCREAYSISGEIYDLIVEPELKLMAKRTP